MSKKTIKKHGKIAFVIGVTIALLGAYAVIPQSNAVAISSISVTINDSRPGVSAQYDFEGTFSTDLIACIEVAFCTTATGGCATAPTGFTSASASSMPGLWSGFVSSQWTASTHTATRLIYTTASAVGGGAAHSFAANTITNPTSTVATTYFGRLNTYTTQVCSGSTTDTGVTAFAIIDGVEISATVAETLTFAIASVSLANCDTDFVIETGVASTASAVAFGELSLNTFHHACQDVTVSTNAGSGYNVTTQETTSLLDGIKTIDDAGGDGGGMTVTASREWLTSTNSGFAYACKDKTDSDCNLSSPSSYLRFACVGTDAQCDPGTGGDSAQTFMSSSGAVNASQSRIEYKVAVSATQEAGSYTNEIVFIATPTF